jgi:hypothetical protein
MLHLPRTEYVQRSVARFYTDTQVHTQVHTQLVTGLPADGLI